MKDGVARAREAVDSGAARDKLAQVAAFSRQTGAAA